MTAVLRALNVYPLKSAGGTAAGEAELTDTGLRHDRRFMLVDPEGRFLSQRKLPALARLRPAYDGAVLTVTVAGAVRGAASDAAAADAAVPDATVPDADSAVAPLVHHERAGGPVREVTVHNKPCKGVDQGDAAADWFRSVLDVDCRLVRFTGRRATSRGGGTVAYADGYPLLLTFAESLADLNQRLTAQGSVPVPMNRFRPNLVIEGLGAYGEDRLRRLRLGDAVVELVKPCARCVVITTDQDTGVRGHEPLRTLAGHRTIDRGVHFGVNAVPRTLGLLRAGDPVEVLETA